MPQSIIRRALPFLAFAAALPLATAANAAVYLFSLTGPNTATFSLNSSPSPDSIGSNYFTLNNVSGTLNGSANTFSTLNFFTTAGDGGFQAGGLDLGGAQLFTGALTSPTFNTGTYSLSDDGFLSFKYSLSITQGGAVPEPASWAMMLLGFAGIGLALRFRRRPAFA